MRLKKRQVLVEFWSVRHLTLRQRHSDARFITSYIRAIRYIISTLYSDIVSTNQFTTSCQRCMLTLFQPTDLQRPIDVVF